MKSNRPLIRQTFRQERFDVLIKKQMEGKATFKDLTELDDIVNRDPEIRECILDEMHDSGFRTDDQDLSSILTPHKAKKTGLWAQFKSLLNRFMLQTHLNSRLCYNI
ncbi:hypothetical protein A0256_17480 [Mucilaginibacter sp. PAMC 26640]|nr:hypothetical protein A0256_17480 [Mucilaginibacter sp. PAMC 26640]